MVLEQLRDTLIGHSVDYVDGQPFLDLHVDESNNDDVHDIVID